MQSLALIAKNMTTKAKLKKFFVDMPKLFSEGRKSIQPHDTAIANALADVEGAYNSLKEVYKVCISHDQKILTLTYDYPQALSGNEFNPDISQGQAQPPQVSQQQVSTNHQNSAYPRSSIQSQESDIMFRRASDDSDTYQAPRYSMPGKYVEFHLLFEYTP